MKIWRLNTLREQKLRFYTPKRLHRSSHYEAFEAEHLKRTKIAFILLKDSTEAPIKKLLRLKTLREQKSLLFSLKVPQKLPL